MVIDVIIFLLTVLIYIPLASILLYVWWKYGKDEPAVKLARRVYLLGSAVLFLFLIFI